MRHRRSQEPQENVEHQRRGNSSIVHPRILQASYVSVEPNKNIHVQLGCSISLNVLKLEDEGFDYLPFHRFWFWDPHNYWRLYSTYPNGSNPRHSPGIGWAATLHRSQGQCAKSTGTKALPAQSTSVAQLGLEKLPMHPFSNGYPSFHFESKELRNHPNLVVGCHSCHP